MPRLIEGDDHFRELVKDYKALTGMVYDTEVLRLALHVGFSSLLRKPETQQESQPGPPFPNGMAGITTFEKT